SIALSLAPDHADLQSQTGVEPSELRETDGHGRLKGRARGFFPSPAYGSDRNASAHRGNESREQKVQNSKPENLLLPTFLTQIPQNVFTQPRAWLENMKADTGRTRVPQCLPTCISAFF